MSDKIGRELQREIARKSAMIQTNGDQAKRQLIQAKAASPFEIASELYLRSFFPDTGVTEKEAKILSEMFGTTAEFWLNLQRNYDESRRVNGITNR